MKLILILSCFLFSTTYSQTTIQDKETRFPISYATISFGNGNGIFADDDGKFIFTKKLYQDIDTLHISSLGYKDLKIATNKLSENILLE